MTEKIRLKDGTELNLIPMGITERTNLRVFKFTSELDHEEILEKFNESNIEKINYILADESIGATYKDCVALKSLTFVPNVQVGDNTVADIYVVAVSTDVTERELQRLGEQTQMTMEAVNTLLLEFIPQIM